MTHWLKIEEAPDCYVSDKGQVKQYNKLLNVVWYKNQKYGKVHPKGLKDNRHDILIARLIAKYFVPNPENKPCVHHKDHNTHNNKASNLEWVTYSENIQYNKQYGSLNTESARKALLKVQKIRVNMCDIKTHKIIRTFNSIKEAAKYAKCSSRTISSVINHSYQIIKGKKYYFKSAGGYYWESVNPIKQESKVFGLGIEGNIIYFPSVAQAAKYLGIDRSTLLRHKKLNHKTYKGFNLFY